MMPSCFAPSYGGGGGGGGRGGIGSLPPEETLWTEPERVCKVPVIMGTTAEEGSLFLPMMLSDARRTSVDFDGAFIKGLLQLRGALNVSDRTLEMKLVASYGAAAAGSETKAAAAEATKAAAAATAAATALVESRTQFGATSAALGDWLFTCPTIRTARALSSVFASAANLSFNAVAGGGVRRSPRPPRLQVFVYTFDGMFRCNPAPAEFGVMHGSDFALFSR